MSSSSLYNVEYLTILRTDEDTKTHAKILERTTVKEHNYIPVLYRRTEWKDGI